MTPPTARTWAWGGHPPVVTVRDRSRRRISIVALCCYKPGEPSRVIYRARFHMPFKGPQGFSWTDYRDLAVRAHLQLDTPIIIIWDHLITHLTIVQLPRYPPASESSGGNLVAAAAGAAGQHRLHRPRPPRTHPPPRPESHPAPPRTHRRLPGRDRTDTHTPTPNTNPKTSRSQPQVAWLPDGGGQRALDLRDARLSAETDQVHVVVGASSREISRTTTLQQTVLADRLRDDPQHTINGSDRSGECRSQPRYLLVTFYFCLAPAAPLGKQLPVGQTTCCVIHLQSCGHRLATPNRSTRGWWPPRTPIWGSVIWPRDGRRSLGGNPAASFLI